MDSNSWEIVDSPARDDKSEKLNDNKSLCDGNEEEEEDEFDETFQQSAQTVTQRYGQNVKNYE
jgi:hypothetical protein